MRVTQYIYKKLQEEFSDLFVFQEEAKERSTQFAEFLPTAALADPSGSPWGQYGNRETPPKRKAVIISFKNLEDAPFSELEKIDEVARFLKCAGFSVWIPVGDELQEYDMQLFNREHIATVGNKSRAEMQKMAISKGVAADEIFFIDDIKKELDERVVEKMIEKFFSLILKDENKFSILMKKQLMIENGCEIGRLMDEGVEFDQLIRLQDDVFELVCKYGFEIRHHLLDLITFERLVGLQPEVCEFVCQNAYGIFWLISMDKKNTLDQLIGLPHEEREFICKNGYQISCLIGNGVTLDQLIELRPKVRELVCENASEIRKIVKIITFERLVGLPHEVCELVCKNGRRVSNLIANEIILDQLIKLPHQVRELVCKNGCGVSNLIAEGITLDQLIRLSPKVFELVCKYASGIRLLISDVITFERLIELPPKVFELVCKYASGIRRLIPDVITFERLIELQSEVRELVCGNASEIRDIRKIITLDQLIRLSPKVFELVCKYASGIRLLIPDVITFERLIELQSDVRELVCEYASGIRLLIPDVITFERLIELPPKVFELVCKYASGIRPLIPDVIRFERLIEMPPKVFELVCKYASDIGLLIPDVITFERLIELSPKVFELVCEYASGIGLLIPDVITFERLIEMPPEMREFVCKNARGIHVLNDSKIPFNFLLSPLNEGEQTTCLSTNAVLPELVSSISLLFYQLKINKFYRGEKIIFPSLPFLNRLEISLDDPSVNLDQDIEICAQKNLIELKINAPILDIQHFTSMLKQLPNLKLLELGKNAIQNDLLQETLLTIAREFPGLKTKLTNQDKIFKFASDDSVSGLSVSRVNARDARVSYDELKDPTLIYRLQVLRHQLVNGLRICLHDIFAYPRIQKAMHNGRLVDYNKQDASEIIDGDFAQIYPRYQQCLALQTIMETAQANIKANPSKALDEYEKVLCQLDQMKAALEIHDGDYKKEWFSDKKTSHKKGFYARITQAIREVSNNLLKINAIPSEKRLDTDFDTKHDSEKKFTMQIACKHLSGGKKDRFQHTRDSIHTLDQYALFIYVDPHFEAQCALPQEIYKLPKNNWHDLYDLYEFNEKVNMEAGDVYALNSLSAQDTLFQIKLNGKTLTEEDIELKKNDQGFYSLKIKRALKGTLTYVIDVSAESEDAWNHIPDALQAIIKKIQSFPSGEVDALTDADCYPKKLSDLSVREKYKLMLDKGKAACRHRVAIFLHELEILKEENAEEYAHISARGVVRGGVHANIEISIDGGGTYQQLDLGGFETKKEYVSIVLPPIGLSSKKSIDAPAPCFSDVLKKINESRGDNTLLCLKDASDIYRCLSQIRNACSARPIFYIDSPDQLRTSLKKLQLNADRTICEIVNPPAGLLHDFLTASENADPAPIIVINWENFKPADIVQFNAVIDIGNRRVDNTLIPSHTTIVGLHSKNEKLMDLLGDSSFISRHANGGVHDLTAQLIPALPEIINVNEAVISGVLRINLHQSPRWLDILMGKAFVAGDVIRWQDGRLLKILADTSISHIELINPPIADRAFDNFVADFRAGLPLTVLNQAITLPRAFNLQVIEKPEFTTGATIHLKQVERLEADTFIINSSTFEQLLHGKKINQEGFLITEKGLMAAHANSTLKLCLHDKLSDSQWSLLLETADNYRVTLELSVTPNIKIPEEIKVNSTASSEISSRVELQNRFIVSNDVAHTVAQLLAPAKIVDFSEVAIDDLFCKLSHHIDEKSFSFTKQYSDIWTALKNGETVILKGKCPLETLNYLSSFFSPTSYFLMEGVKETFSGKLIVVADESLKIPSWLYVEKQTVLAKQEKLVIPELTLSPIDSNDLSLDACVQFENNRLETVKNVLRSTSPYVVLEGAPGVGKSYFVRALQNDPTVKFYRENEVEKWATDIVSDGVHKILFRDEINLRGIDCSQDRDLLNNPPSIFANGKYYPLSKNCKIMYAQNSDGYGGERREPQLFQDFPECKVQFEQMSKAFILHRILKPIYETTFKPSEFPSQAEKNAEAIIPDDLMKIRSIRDLQTKAIFECAKEKKERGARAVGEEIIAPPINRRMTCLGKKDFILTTSRYEPYQQMLTLLQARTFKRELPDDAPDGARFNGTNGLVLKGPPGVGKSEFIISVLESENYFPHDFVSKKNDDKEKGLFDAAVQLGCIYYRLSASVSIEQKLEILHQAWKQGAFLIIDEIDSCPLLEDYLNAYLVGEDIHGERPEKPGFTILSTANGIAMKGRRALPEPLLSRMIALEFNEYPRDDLIHVLEAKFIIAPLSDSTIELKRDIIAFLVDGFLTEQHTNKDAPPTFRDLDVVAKSYFESNFNQYVRLGLSKDQHEFMLAYREHPQLPNLMRRLESRELDVKKITLPQLEKALKTTNNSPGLFSNRNNVIVQVAVNTITPAQKTL